MVVYLASVLQGLHLVEVGVFHDRMAHDLICLQDIRISRINTDSLSTMSRDMNSSYQTELSST